ncbi:hypothetical protein NCG89_10050 [Spongiibacter taiwanensis]|uniref:hypothetical protein n=1 Tax=Spongiibacter taiwanensis TaxID=1748242 RepID=UPI002035B785|nr:hypothetical protein [Spongiibacter taiwanensis]USA41860.1 hypothetical protein NCG89_10050 [Spongiibacter taiwanensis]
MKFPALITALCLALSGCSTSPALTGQTAVNGTAPAMDAAQQLQWETLLGSWYGAQSTHDGRRYEWIVSRRPDGIYRLDSRFIDSDGEIKSQIEYGEWSLSGPIYFTTPRAAEEDGEMFEIGRDGPEFGIAYHILSLAADEIVVKAYSDNSVFTSIRVKFGTTFAQIDQAGGVDALLISRDEELSQ